MFPSWSLGTRNFVGARYCPKCQLLLARNEGCPIYHQKLFALLKTYFVTGGMPEVIMTFVNNREDPLTAFRLARELQSQLLFHYEHDFSKYSNKYGPQANPEVLYDLFRKIPFQVGRKFSILPLMVSLWELRYIIKNSKPSSLIPA